MPLNLHQACQQRLVDVLGKVLSMVTTSHGTFLERRSFYADLYAAEDVIPTTPSLKTRLTEYVDEFPVVEFIDSTLALELIERDQHLPDVNRSS
jgi:hypothetical protein